MDPNVEMHEMIEKKIQEEHLENVPDIRSIVDREAAGSHYNKYGLPINRSRCPLYKGYWCNDSYGSVQCAASSALLPDIVYQLACSRDYENCPYLRSHRDKEKEA